MSQLSETATKGPVKVDLGLVGCWTFIIDDLGWVFWYYAESLRHEWFFLFRLQKSWAKNNSDLPTLPYPDHFAPKPSSATTHPHRALFNPVSRNQQQSPSYTPTTSHFVNNPVSHTKPSQPNNPATKSLPSQTQPNPTNAQTIRILQNTHAQKKPTPLRPGFYWF